MHVTTKKEYIVDTQKAIELNRKSFVSVTDYQDYFNDYFKWLGQEWLFAIDGPFRESIALRLGRILILSWFKLRKWFYRLSGKQRVIGHICWALFMAGFIILWESWLVLVSTRRWGDVGFVDDDTYNKYIGYLDKGRHSSASSLVHWFFRWFPMYGGRTQSYDL